MNLILNGDPRSDLKAKHISELIEELGLPPQVVLVEHNGAALRREEWMDCLLEEGDRLEIIRIVAGG